MRKKPLLKKGSFFAFGKKPCIYIIAPLLGAIEITFSYLLSTYFHVLTTFLSPGGFPSFPHCPSGIRTCKGHHLPISLLFPIASPSLILHFISSLKSNIFFIIVFINKVIFGFFVNKLNTIFL